MSVRSIFGNKDPLVRAFPSQNAPPLSAMLALLLILPLWVFGVAVLIGVKAAFVSALVIPFAQALGFWGLIRPKSPDSVGTRDPLTGLSSRMDMEALINARLAAPQPTP